MQFFAHAPPSPANDADAWHELSAHLIGTGERAAHFLKPIGAGELGRLAGLLHDVGKFTREFQERLRGSPARVDHSTAGAKLAVERYGPQFGRLLAFPVAGHHAGLADGTGGHGATLETRLARKFGGNGLPILDSSWRETVDLPDRLPIPPVKNDPERPGFAQAFFIRMLFSALVDADRLDTEAYFDGIEGRTPQRGGHPDLIVLQDRLAGHLAELEASGAQRSDPGVHTLRQEVLAAARTRAELDPGLFTLTVPTGGGKTLASLAFALGHAIRHAKRRVIYVIPFTSIVEQTAAVFRAALERPGDDVPVVLEHHGTFDETRVSKREAWEKLQLAMENWETPVVVTTAVQFFESLFANRPSRCRKLHNLIDSVIILDEAQTLPLHHLRPCVAALDELARNYRGSIVLCTATQPALDAENFPNGFSGVREIAPEPSHLYHGLKRVTVENAGELDDETLADRVAGAEQVLCIVNTRRHARELFARVADREGAFHLTTLMCARHRADILSRIRTELANARPVRLIATSLVEAGVDIDFPLVLRALAGIDSLAQAAGRCNREGRLGGLGRLVVFTAAPGPGRAPPAEVSQYADAARGVLRQYPDPLTLDAIEAYFGEVYWMRSQEMDKCVILDRLAERAGSLDFPFSAIARDFRVIDSALRPVIVPYRGPDGDESRIDRLIEKLLHVERPGRLARDLQPYTVQVGEKERSALISVGAAQVLNERAFGDQFVRLVNEGLYDPGAGLHWDDPTFSRAEAMIL